MTDANSSGQTILDVNEENLANLPAPRAPASLMRRPVAIVPRTLAEAQALATALHRSRLAPRNFQTPDAVLYAILAGAEAGLPPIAALKSIMIVNGLPSLWGDGVLAVVRASGRLEYIRELVERDDRGIPIKATCTVRRRGDPEEVARTYSRQDAMTAGLWGKSGPWQTSPGRMLQSKARNFALRDTFPDVLMGLTDANYGDTEAEMIDVTYDAMPSEPEPEPEPRRSDPLFAESKEK